jgi:hypothetical protein
VDFSAGFFSKGRHDICKLLEENVLPINNTHGAKLSFRNEEQTETFPDKA